MREKSNEMKDQRGKQHHKSMVHTYNNKPESKL